jgi:hypothetical protein
MIVWKIFISGLYPVSKQSTPLLKSLIVFHFTIQISIWQIFEKILFKIFFFKNSQSLFLNPIIGEFFNKKFKKKLTNA